jgi:hypothetical protein
MPNSRAPFCNQWLSDSSACRGTTATDSSWSSCALCSLWISW